MDLVLPMFLLLLRYTACRENNLLKTQNIFGKHCFTLSSTVIKTRIIENLVIVAKCATNKYFHLNWQKELWLNFREMKQNAQLFQMLAPVLKTVWDHQDPLDLP